MPQELFDRADELEANGHLDEALVHWRQLVTGRPTRNALLRFGGCAKNLGLSHSDKKSSAAGLGARDFFCRLTPSVVASSILWPTDGLWQVRDYWRRVDTSDAGPPLRSPDTVSQNRLFIILIRDVNERDHAVVSGIFLA